jgi:exosome complex component RRP4
MMMKNEKDFVIPGEKIVDSMDFIPGRNCFRDGNAVKSKKIGVVSVSNRVISVIPLNGTYAPRVDDMVIGEIKDIQSNGWIVDMGIAHNAFLPLSGIREFIDTTRTQLSSVYAVGELIYTKISSQNNPDSFHLSMDDVRCRKLRGGRVLEINAAKVPRLIGREGSMIRMIKEKTRCNICVGQNGLIWMDGENQDVALEAIREIDSRPQQDGLTDKISAMLDSRMGVVQKSVANNVENRTENPEVK